MKQLMASICVLVIVCLVGCAKGPTREEFLKKETECLKCYCVSNATAAEAALLECARYARQCQEAGVKGIEYDEVLARIYGRLYLVERHLGNSGTAEQYLQKVAQLYNVHGRAPLWSDLPLVEKQALIEEKIDQGLMVAWKTQ